MRIRWKNLLFRIAIWVVAEIAFNLIGLDDLADYEEFVLGHRQLLFIFYFVAANSTWILSQTKRRLKIFNRMSNLITLTEKSASDI
jgi:hypothetical protein